jgi:hypothetical protein
MEVFARFFDEENFVPFSSTNLYNSNYKCAIDDLCTFHISL